MSGLKGSDIELVDGTVKQVVGNRECGFMNEEQWDKMVSADCKREYDKAIDLSLSEPIKVVNASDQRSCAEEAEGIGGAVFWVYDLKTTQCHLVDGQGIKVDEPGKVLGNYECSVLSEEQWEAMGRLKPEDRQKLGNHLMSPQNCPNSPEGLNTQGANGHDDAKVSKRPPVIDLFLNPSRSEELRNMMKISEESRTGFVPQVLLTVNNNIVRLQDHFLALFCRRSFRKCIQTFSACSGSQPCPASAPKTHPLLHLTCSGSAGGGAAR